MDIYVEVVLNLIFKDGYIILLRSCHHHEPEGNYKFTQELFFNVHTHHSQEALAQCIKSKVRNICWYLKILKAGDTGPVSFASLPMWYYSSETVGAFGTVALTLFHLFFIYP